MFLNIIQSKTKNLDTWFDFREEQKRTARDHAKGIEMCGYARHCVFKLQLIFSQANTSQHNDGMVSPQESNETECN